MKFPSIVRPVLCILMAAAGVRAAAIDYTTGLATGVLFLGGRLPELRDGLQLQFPIVDYMANKSYTSQMVPINSDEKSEAFAAVAGNKSLGFGSAVSNGHGALEVGVEDGLRSGVFWWAVSRFFVTIKNNTEEDHTEKFFYTIEPGELGILGVRHDLTTHVRVDAAIDYRLLSPEGPFGGTFEETTGRLMSFFVDIDFDDTLTHSTNASVILLSRTFTELIYATAGLRDSIVLPTIPAHGELTIYYDMYSLLDSRRAEVGGYARLGDPTDLVSGEGGGLEAIAAAGAPEPAAMWICGAGLIAIGMLGRRRLKRR